MTRTEAVARILRDIGFRPAGGSLDDVIVSCLKEAQKELQKGKTLPRFLLNIDAQLTLAAGDHSVTLPADFIRESDETRIRFFSDGSDVPTYLQRKYYIDASMANLHGSADSLTTNDPVAPSVYIVRVGRSAAFLDFITTADVEYTLYWDYYSKAAELATGDTENEWLADDAGALWLIGTAGIKVATPLNNTGAVAGFQALQQQGRAACFGEDLAAETASGPVRMGANL